MSGSGMSRISPTGPYVASGARVSRLVNDCIPLTRPMPLCIRRASWPTWVLLPRMTPPLSQYRKRTSWSPLLLGLGDDLIGCHRRASMLCGVDGEPPVPGTDARGPAVGSLARSRYGRRHLHGDDLATEGELAALDVDDGHALLRDVASRREGDLAGDPREVLGRLDGRLDGRRIGAARPLDGVASR